MEQPGSAWTGEEQSEWKVAMSKFMGHSSASSSSTGATLAKRAKVAKRAPRIASLDFLRALDHSLSSFYGIGLQHFLPGNHDRCLTLCLDECGTNWCPVYFLKNHKRLRVEALFDGFHRRANDMDRAISSAGFTMTVMKGHVCNNICYGPWQSGAYYKDLSEAAQDMMGGMDPDDDLLVHFWPLILQDRGLPLALHDNHASRKEFLEQLSTEHVFEVKGPKSSPSRFFSWNHATKFHDSMWHTQTLVIAYLAIRRGWVNHYSELLPSSRLMGNSSLARQSTDPAVVAQPSASEPSPASSSRGAADSVSQVTSKSGARQAIVKDKQKAKNTLHCVLQYRCDPEFRHETRLVSLLTSPLAVEHNEAFDHMKTTEKAIQYFASMARFSWLKPLREVLQAGSCLSALSRCGFEVSPSVASGLQLDDPLVLDQNALATKAFGFMVNILKHRCSSMMWHSGSFPGMSALLLSENNKDRAFGFDFLEKSHQAYEWALQQGPEAEEIARRSGMHGEVMQLVCRLAKEGDFSTVSPRLRSVLMSIWGGFSQTIVVERCNKILREKETRSNNSKTLGRTRRWESLVLSDVMQPFGIKQLSVDKFTDKCCSNLDIDRVFEHPAQDDFNLKEITGDQKWTTFSPHSVRRTYAELHLLLASHGKRDASLLCQGWKSAFLPEHCIVLERIGETSGHFIVCTLGCSALTWPAKLVGGGKDVMLDLGAQELKWFSVIDLNAMYIVPYEVVSPLHHMMAKVSLGITMRVTGKPMKLLDWQCQRGWAHVPEFALRKLHETLGIEQPSSNSVVHGCAIEDALTASLIVHYKKGCTDQEIASILASRQWAESQSQLLDGADIDPVAMEDCLLPSDRREFCDAIDGASKAKHRIEKRADRSLSLVHKVCLAVKKAPKPHDSVVSKLVKSLHKKKGARWWNHMDGSLQDITSLKPDKVSVVCDQVNGRFLFHHSAMPTERKSISWTRRGQRLAMIESLKVMWGWEADVSGMICPLPLAEMRT